MRALFVMLVLAGCHVGGFGLRTGNVPSTDERPVVVHRWAGEATRLRAIVTAANELGLTVRVELAPRIVVWIGPYIPTARPAVRVRGFGAAIDVIAEATNAQALARRIRSARAPTRASRLVGLLLAGEPNPLRVDASHCELAVPARTPNLDPHVQDTLYISLPGGGLVDIRARLVRPTATQLVELEANHGIGTTCGTQSAGVVATRQRRIDGTNAFRPRVDDAIASATRAADGALSSLDEAMRRALDAAIADYARRTAPLLIATPDVSVDQGLLLAGPTVHASSSMSPTWSTATRRLQLTFVREVAAELRRGRFAVIRATVIVEIDRRGRMSTLSKPLETVMR